MPSRLPGEEAVYFVYIMASRPYGTLYIGITSDLISRVQQHRSGEKPGFTTRYKVYTLVYYEPFGDVMAAIQREKTMKKWKRDWKCNLIAGPISHLPATYLTLVGDLPGRTLNRPPANPPPWHR